MTGEGSFDTVQAREISAEKIGGSTDIAITAFSGGGQTNAYQIKSPFNVVTVSGADGDSVKLPAGFPVGTRIWIQNNDAAQEIDVFPGAGDDLGAGANTAVRIVEGHAMCFLATVANTTWMQMLWA